jgi:hypothetical protein
VAYARKPSSGAFINDRRDAWSVGNLPLLMCTPYPLHGLRRKNLLPGNAISAIGIINPRG